VISPLGVGFKSQRPTTLNSGVFCQLEMKSAR
jgi:hypothetical protein